MAGLSNSHFKDEEHMTELSIQELHEKFLFPTVLVRTKKAGGSGSVIFSRKTDINPDEPEEYSTFVLTNGHVIDDAVEYKTEWDNFAKKEVKKELRSPVDVHFFKYKYQSQQIGTYSVTAQIVAFNKEEDLALLKLDDPNAAKYIAKLYSREKLNELRIFDKVICVGAGLGHSVFPTHGEITSLMGPDDIIENKQYMMTSAASIFGNSGGALYLKRTQELIGVPSRISVALVGFGGSPISHMSYSIPFTRIYQFLEDNCFQFIYDSNQTEKQCGELRKKKEESQRKYFSDVKS